MIEHAVYLLGAAADWYTTKRGLKKGAQEANPVVEWLREKVGPDWAMTLSKGGLWTGLLIAGAPATIYYVAGGVGLAAAAWNRWGVKV